MQAERDHLVRFVFPRLREELLAHRIHLVDVDLRWGITSEENVLEACREIVDECRPRFLCILGGRYGWIPPGKDRSITAEEVYYGVLDRSLKEHGYAFFYFREDSVSATMRETTPGEYREPSGSENETKLAELKKAITGAGFTPRLYTAQWDDRSRRLIDLKKFGEWVFDDIIASIRSDPDLEQYFAGDLAAQVDEFPEENSAIEAFIEDHAERFVLGSRQNVIQDIQSRVLGEEGKEFICLTGSPGSGKSALLAYLSRQLSLKCPDNRIVISHFVGASFVSTDVRCTLRRLCHELKMRCPAITADIPDDPEKLRFLFADFLRKASAGNQVIIILDAVNQFDIASYSGGLRWLTEDLPKGASFILSTIEGPALDELRTRIKDLTEYDLKPLTRADSGLIITQFLKRYRKHFEPDQYNALLGKTDAGIPLYLLASLEELRTLGTYEEITGRIRELPPTIHDLFVWILNRLEQDDGFRDSNGLCIGRELVPHCSALLCASRSGLSQQELIEMLAPGDAIESSAGPDSQGNVAALIHLLRPYLMYRGELLDFYHVQFRNAVRDTYLQTEEKRQGAHQDLAGYFYQKSDPSRDHTWAGNYPRGLSELPYHQTQGRQWDDLYTVLTDFLYLERKCDSGSRELRNQDIVEILNDPSQGPDLACDTCGFKLGISSESLEYMHLGTIWCPVCGTAIHLVNLRGVRESEADEWYQGTCSVCGHSTPLLRSWFPDNTNRARFCCRACGSREIFTRPVTHREKVFTGVYPLLADYQYALNCWPGDPNRKAHYNSLSHIYHSIRKEHHSWQYLPALLFPHIFPYLWWGPEDLRSDLRLLCREYCNQYSSRGPWLRQITPMAPQNSVEFRESLTSSGTCLHFCKKGTILAAGTNTGELLLIDLSTGLQDSIQVGTTYIRQIMSIMKETGEEEELIICGGEVFAVSLSGRTPFRRIPHLRSISTATLSHNGNLLAAGTGLGLVKIFDVQTGSLVREYSGRHVPVAHIAFSGNDATLLAIGVNGQGTIFEMPGLTPKGRLNFNYSPEVVLPDVSGESWWIVRAGKLEHLGGTPYSITHILDLQTRGVRSGTLSPGGEIIALGNVDGRVTVVTLGDKPRFTQPIRLNGGIISIAISEQHLGVMDEDGNYEVHHLDAILGSTGNLPDEYITRPCYSTDKSTIIAGTTKDVGVFIGRDYQKGQERLPGSFHFYGPADMAFAQNRWVAAGKGGNWKCWDIASRGELGRNGAAGEIRAIAASPDGGMVASGHMNGTVILWDLLSGAEIGRTKLTDDSITALAFHPLGLTLYAIGARGCVYSWQLENETNTRELTVCWTDTHEKHSDRFLQHVRLQLCWSQKVGYLSGGFAANRDGTQLAVGAGHRIMLLDPLEGNELFQLAQFEADWTTLEYSPDNSQLLAISTDGWCCLFDMTSRDLCAQFELTGEARGCSWRPDGTEFSVVKNDGNLLVFRIEAHEPTPPLVSAQGRPPGSLTVTCPYPMCTSAWKVNPADIGSVQACPECRRKVKIGGTIRSLERMKKNSNEKGVNHG